MCWKLVKSLKIVCIFYFTINNVDEILPICQCKLKKNKCVSTHAIIYILAHTFNLLDTNSILSS